VLEAAKYNVDRKYGGKFLIGDGEPADVTMNGPDSPMQNHGESENVCWTPINL